MRKYLICWLALICVPRVFAQSFDLELVGEFILPTSHRALDSEIGGLSGIDYSSVCDCYYLLSDARGKHARFYTADIDVSASGIHGIRFLTVRNILASNGRRYSGAYGEPDPESIRFDRSSGNLYWTSEGGGLPENPPRLLEMALDGGFVRALPIVRKYLSDIGRSRGVRKNRGFESLSLSHDGDGIYVATESSLRQDGPVATVDDGAHARLAYLSKTTGAVVSEYVYPIGNIPHAPPGHRRAKDNGLVEILALDDGRILALERAYAAGVGNAVSLYLVDVDGGTDVSSFESLQQQRNWTALSKTLVLDFGRLASQLTQGRAASTFAAYRPLDNIEGMAFGPILDGARSLIFVSDNNFGMFGPQFTQFLAFKLQPKVE